MADVAIRDFAMSFADLITTCNTIHVFMERDATEFTGYGVLAIEITAFETKINEFEELPTDTELEADVVNATSAKNQIAEELRIMLRTYEVRAKLAFGSDTGTYKKFHIKDLSRQSDNDLLVFGRMVKRSAEEYLVQLTPFGLTQPMIDDLEAKNQDFEDSIDTQKSAIATRDDATNNRVKKANEIYALLIKYCDIGKSIWYEVNEAKYNDYIIYTGGSVGGGTPDIPPAAPELSYSLDGFDWEEVPTATSYQLVYRFSSGTEWIELYSGPFIEEPVPFAPGEGEWIVRIRARNSAGYGDWSEERPIFFGLHAPQNVSIVFTGIPNNFLVVYWASVMDSNYIEVYRSVVPMGAPEGGFTLQGTVRASPRQQPATFGMRTYYYLIAKNDIYTSPHSAKVFYDVPVV